MQCTGAKQAKLLGCHGWGNGGYWGGSAKTVQWLTTQAYIECDIHQETSESSFTLATAVENKREEKEKAENLKETIHELELTLKDLENKKNC